jgi:hypothetical protein
MTLRYKVSLFRYYIQRIEDKTNSIHQDINNPSRWLHPKNQNKSQIIIVKDKDKEKFVKKNKNQL